MKPEDRDADDSLTAMPDDKTATQIGAGTRLGPYLIEGQLGAGGMGEVFRATDTRLGRPVAIKITQERFTERFNREARAISSLNHPHICTLYDVGPNYIVMELCEGETLAARLKRGKFSLEDTIRYGALIADALSAAHARDIVHRDLKPQNIMLTKSGVKVLDFGLAKSQQDETITRSRMVVGTPAYMAPEQKEGKECDARTDIYALGLMLYEIATGKRASQEQIPPLDALPPHLAHVIERCLAQDPDERWQTASDVRRELEWTAKSRPATETANHGTSVRWAWAAWSAAAALAVLAGWAFLRIPAANPLPVSRWTMALDSPAAAGAGVALSHDGTHLAYAKEGQIWVRALDQLEDKPVRGTQGGRRPVFSPDGQWLAFLPTAPMGPIKKIPVNGGSPTVICEDGSYYGASWGADGTLVFSGSTGLMLAASSGGKCEPLTISDPQKGEAHRWPQILPGGQAVVFAIFTPGELGRSHLAAVELKSRTIHVLENTGAAVRYAPSGHLLYIRDGTLFAAPFDERRLAVTGPEAPVVEGVYYNSTGGFGDYTFSDAGLLVYSAEVRNLDIGTLALLDRKGSPRPLAAPPKPYVQLRVSPDGKRAAVTVSPLNPLFGDLWTLELERGGLTRLTSEGYSSNPVWAPDGQRVAFFAQRVGQKGIFWIAADGSGAPEQLLVDTYEGLPASWTPDGKTLFYSTRAPRTIWTLAPGSKPQPFVQPSYPGGDPAVSPDGRWLAYSSDESGKTQVYVRALSSPGARVAISIEGGELPRWSGDGRELFYRDPVKQQLVAVDVESGPALKAGQPKALFGLGDVPWDVTPDGTRFLVAQRQGNPPTAKLQVVVNWFEDLRRRAPSSQ